MNARKLRLILINILTSTILFSNVPGKITGRVIDFGNGETLMGANVILEGLGAGAATDLDGSYFINNVPPGSHTIIVSYIGYNMYRINNVKINSGELLRFDISLKKQNLQMSSVIVEAQAIRTGDAYLLSKQKNSINIQDGVSAAQISRSGDSNAAEAAKRICGITIMDDKYVYVRGLGDRYTTTEMNGVPIPSPDPEKKTVPLNLFPSALLESVTAYKTYTPDMPGAFAGGNVNIKTKAYPDNKIYKMSFSLGHKSYPKRGQTYYSLKGGSLDFFGYDDGTRRLPTIIPDTLKLDEWNSRLDTDTKIRKKLLGDVGRAFNTDFALNTGKTLPPISAGITYGNRFNPTSNFEWGFFTNTTFSNDYTFKESDVYEYSLLKDVGLDPGLSIENEKSEYNTNLASTFSAGMKLYNKHKINLHYIYTHRSQSYVNKGRGYAFQFDDGIFVKQYYVEKAISNLTLSGTHQFKFLTDHKLEWSFSNGRSKLDQPDFRGYNYRVKTQDVNGNPNVYYQMDTYSWSSGTRDFTKGYDRNRNFDINYATSINDRFDELYKLKIGTRFQKKSRDFYRRAFYHKYATEWGGGAIPPDITVVYDENLLGATLVDSNYFDIGENGDVIPGLILVESTQPSDGYESSEKMVAEYLMIDIPLGFGLYRPLNIVRFIGGLRREKYNISLYPYSPINHDPFVSVITGDTVKANLHKIDFLPSYNIFIQLPNNFNIRLSHSRTVAKAEFREIAPFEFQAFYGDDIVVGYPWLKTTNIFNYDIRFEWYRAAGEVLALSLFRKNFKNPIESALIEASGKVYRTYQNADNARSWGVEVDSKTHLGFIPARHGRAFLLFNFTWTQSEVEIDSLVTIFTGYSIKNDATSRKRPLQGQSDFILNFGIYYNNLKGFYTSLSYNVFSKRLISLGVASIPDEYELPFHSLNLTASKSFKKAKVSAKIKNILNSKMVIGQKDPFTGDFKSTLSYKPKMSFSIGVSYDL
jgi:hypothetical protein